MNLDNEFIDIVNINERELHNDIALTDTLITFDIFEYLNDIAESYHFDNNIILQQFKTDFTRTVLYINNIHMTELNTTMDILNKYSKYTVNILQIIQLNSIIMMILTQAGYAYPYMLISKLYANPKNNIHVSCCNINRYLEINEDILFRLVCEFKVINIETSDTQDNIKLEILIDIYHKNNTYQISKYGILMWNYFSK